MTISDFFFGKPETTEQLPAISPEQLGYLNQILSSLGGPTASAFQYLQDLFSDDPEALERMFAPERREFEERTVPGIAERFTGMGAGAQSSSAFQQALGQAGSSLSEKLASMREGQRATGLQALMGFGQQALGTSPFGYKTTAAQPGFLQELQGPLMAAAGAMGGGYLGQSKGFSSAGRGGGKAASRATVG